MQITLTSEEFDGIIQRKLSFEKYSDNIEVRFDGASYKIIFNNIIFNSPINIVEHNFGNINFIDCKFRELEIKSPKHSNFLFHHTLIDSFLCEFEKNGNIQLQFDDCIVKYFSSNNCTIKLNILLSEIAYFRISKSTATINISNCVCNTLNIINSLILLFETTHSTILQLLINNNSNGKIRINEYCLIDELTILDSGKLDIINDPDSDFALTDSIVNTINISDSNFKDFNIRQGNKFLCAINNINLNNTSINNFKIESTIILTLEISNVTLKTDDTFIITDCNLAFVWMHNVTALGFLGFYRSKVMPLKDTFNAILEDSSNISENNLYEKFKLPSGSSLKITDTDLGKAIFTSCDFSDSTLVTTFSNFLNIQINGSSLPDVIESPSKEGNLNYQYLRETYAQLKKVFENKSDNIMAMRYYAYELNAHRLDLKSKNKKLTGELFMLNVNKITNNFGESWPQALKALVIVAIPIYTLYLFSLGIFPSSNYDTDLTIKTFGLILDFINPIHKTNEIADKLGITDDSINGISIAIEGFSRIILGFLIYQLIAAFRKYGKRSNS